MRTPCFALLPAHAGESAGNLSRTAIGGASRLRPNLLNAKGFSSRTAETHKVQFKEGVT